MNKTYKSNTFITLEFTFIFKNLPKKLWRNWYILIFRKWYGMKGSTYPLALIWPFRREKPWLTRLIFYFRSLQPRPVDYVIIRRLFLSSGTPTDRFINASPLLTTCAFRTSWMSPLLGALSPTFAVKARVSERDEVITSRGNVGLIKDRWEMVTLINKSSSVCNGNSSAPWFIRRMPASTKP